MAMSTETCAGPALVPLTHRRSPYTAPWLITECVKAALQAYHLASTGTAAARFLCEASAPSCHCPDRIAPRIVKRMPARASVIGFSLPELRKRVERKAGAVAAAARVGIRWLAHKVGGFLGKWCGAAVGALFSPAGAIVGAAIGIALGGLIAQVLSASI